VSSAASDQVLIGTPSAGELSHQLLGTAWRPGGRAYRLGLTVAGLGTLWLLAMIAYTVVVGIGLWGNNIPVGWGFGIINFVWWIGIGHAGTFISAILLLLAQPWRTSINRFAEAMTLFAVANAAIFPLLHLGRPWFAYWLFPYPSLTGTWPQLKSALPWDAAAITTYGTVSLLFFYVGLLPDLASARDLAPTRGKRIAYGIFALGWRGSASAWRHYRMAYLLLGGLATPLVISVHSIVSSDFAITLVPGWHSTVFPPFFVAGAIFSGFAMVLLLLIPARTVFSIENVVTIKHLENMAKLLLVTGWMLTYGYLLEIFMGWYSGDPFEMHIYLRARPAGPGAWVFWSMMLCNSVVPQLFWSRRLRRSPKVLFAAALLISFGMWAERFVIIAQSLQQEFLVSSWDIFIPTWVDLSIFFGTISLFLFLFLLFLRFVPFVPLAEVKELNAEQQHQHQASATEEPGAPALPRGSQP
jgi:Ni/Fe-hydrogenase subunit HybB-like protein